MYDTMNNAQTLMGNEKPLLAGRYQAIRPLGSGGMGSVWLVEDTQLDNKLFAVKMLPPIMFSNKRAFLQLKKEALVAMNLVHPNIVQIRAFEENNGAPFLVMDYIEGQTLDDYIADKDDGVLSEEETVRLLKPIAEALDYAHGEGVVHRDIKPANVMIRKDGRPFILDFGIACEVQETMSRMTGSKLSSGTLPYMSPEQVNGEPPKPAHDVYSFAAMVYECLKGEPPFVRGEIIHQILNNPPPPLPQGIVSWLSEITMRGLAKKADERPATCCEIFGGSSSGGDNADNDIKIQTQEAIDAYHDEEALKQTEEILKKDEVFDDVMREFQKTTRRDTSKPFSRPAVIQGRPKKLRSEHIEPEKTQDETATPPDSAYSTGRKGEYRIDGTTYVDVSGKGLLGTMVSSFFAGMNGKGVVTGWDRMSGAWDQMKKSEGSYRRRKK